MESLLANRYQIKSHIGSGSMGNVFKAYDRLTSQNVAIKRVPLNTATTEDRLALAQEFRTLASLRFPNIISVLNYGFDEERHPFIAMELLEDAQSVRRFAKSSDNQLRARLIIELLQALAYLHRRDIIHRDIKPENVLVTNDHIKVLDFGLATFTTLVGRDLEDGSQEGSGAGTLPYMAPEVIGGKAASVASDLYAVGVIAYELFAGKHPFETKNITKLINQVLSEMPDTSILDIPLDMAMVLNKLLSKNPTDRYLDANTTLKAVTAAFDMPLNNTETHVIRESQLQSAGFVGREEELALLSNSMERLKRGIGEFWLIGGESGIGKSRILTEIRTQALVEGLTVFNGQVDQEGNTLYQLWRNVLRHLCLHVAVSSDEASVLRGIIPDIGTLLNINLPDIISLTPQENLERLLAVVEELFSRLQQPCVIILEDIHWAIESLSILERLARLAGQLPLMILASYRTEESGNLVERFPTAQHILLERLDQAQIEKLSSSIIGDVQEKPELIKLLHRETEGNILFILEVIRTLAQNAGGLEDIARVTLPQHVLSGGIREVIEHRLANLTPESTKQLQYAALLGRQPNIQVLRQIMPDVDWDIHLSQWSDRAIMEVNSDVWQFTHDKIRRYLLEPLEEDQRETMHQDILDAMEKVFPDSPDLHQTKAYHAQRAHNDEREIHYLHLAADQNLRNGAYTEAAVRYQRARDLLQAQPDSEANQRELLHVLISLGTTLIPMRGETDPEVLMTFQDAQVLSDKVGTRVEVFRVLLNQSIYFLSTGQLTRSLDLAEKCLASAVEADDTHLLIEGHYLVSNAHFWMGSFKKADEGVRKVMELYDRQTHASHSAEYGQDPFIITLTYGTWNRWILGFADQATELAFEPLSVARELGSESFNMVLALETIAWHFFHLQDVEACKEHATELLILAAEQHFPFYHVIAELLLGWVEAHEGAPQVARKRIIDAQEDWLDLNAGLLLPLFNLILADAELKAGDTAAATEALDKALQIAKENKELTYLSELHRMRASVEKADDRLDDAKKSLKQALKVSRKQKARTFELRALMDLCELDPSTTNLKKLEKTYDTFEEGFFTMDLLRAASLLPE